MLYRLTVGGGLFLVCLVLFYSILHTMAVLLFQIFAILGTIWLIYKIWKFSAPDTSKEE